MLQVGQIWPGMVRARPQPGKKWALKANKNENFAESTHICVTYDPRK